MFNISEAIIFTCTESSKKCIRKLSRKDCFENIMDDWVTLPNSHPASNYNEAALSSFAYVINKVPIILKWHQETVTESLRYITAYFILGMP